MVFSRHWRKHIFCEIQIHSPPIEVEGDQTCNGIAGITHPSVPGVRKAGGNGLIYCRFRRHIVEMALCGSGTVLMEVLFGPSLAVPDSAHECDLLER
jgi:hypothetical protein